MTRAEKIKKLANAIREYRGAFVAETGVWIRDPKPSRMAGIRLWIDRLGILTAESIETIENFRSRDEFNAWLRGL